MVSDSIEYRRAVKHAHSMERRKNDRKTKQWLTLERWAIEEGWTSGAEIGVARGWTLFHLLNNCPALSMIGVDQWIDAPVGDVPGVDSYAHMAFEHISIDVKRRAEAYGERCRILHMPSLLAAPKVADASLDFVFIDGDHTEAGARTDIVAWVPKVRPGGWVTGHDWHRPEVLAVIDRLLPGWERHDNHCWRIRRDAVALP